MSAVTNPCRVQAGQIVRFDGHYSYKKRGGSMASHTTYFWQHALLSALAVFSTASLALTPSQVFESVKDSVVVVKTLGVEGKEIAMGSGVLLPSGKVATNCHVMKNGISFQVGRGRQFVDATFYAGDIDKDICLLSSKGVGGKPAKLGKAANLKVGDSVYAVGAPRGLELSLSDGIVSQLRGASPPFIQTTAAISPGSSGGGLFDSGGRLVGFTTLYIDDGQSLNFAMPVEWLNDIQPANRVVSKQRSQVDWLTRAVALEEKQDWPELLVWGRQWVKAEQENADALFFVGNALLNLGQLDLATAAYREVLRINPEYDKAWGNLGLAYKKLQQADNAINAYRQALRINPEAAYTWNNLGNIYSELQQTDNAINAYRQALRITPEKADIWRNLGLVYGNTQRNEDAITAYRQALHIDPGHAEAWYGLGRIYTDLKGYEDAIAAYRQAVRIKPKYGEAWNNLGFVYKNLQRFDEAIFACQQALRINPEDTHTLINLATTYYLSGNTPGALQTLASLRPLDPVSADKLFNLFVPR